MPRFTKVMRFHVELLDTCPLIWRKLLVPNSYSFWDLHCAITDAFAWKDYHLHRFEIRKPGKRRADMIGIPDEEGFEDFEILPGWKIFIKDYFTKQGVRAKYVYDFGDDWVHGMLFEGVAEAIKGVRYPVCIGGAMAGPPEDCGGICGYERFKKAIGDPTHPEYREMLDWIGGEFDPAAFNPAAVRFLNPFQRFRVAFHDEEPPDEWNRND